MFTFAIVILTCIPILTTKMSHGKVQSGQTLNNIQSAEACYPKCINNKDRLWDTRKLTLV